MADKLLGINPNQVPTNSDLGSAAFQDAGSFIHSRRGKLAELEATLYSDTQLNDIRASFIYDTSLDSDGGAWRKRTKHTSWYNEELNTTLRGNRREFPSVAIIIVEDNRTVIYDGDDPAFPMWMIIPEWNATADPVFSIHANVLGDVCAMNGIIGFSATFYRYYSFIEDMAYLYDNTTKYSFNGRPIGDRNYYSDNGRTPLVPQGKGLPSGGSGGVYRSVTYKIYPGAKTDPSTGLPSLTALITGNHGFDVIRHHGSDHSNEIVHSRTQSSSGVIVHFGDFYPDQEVPMVNVGWYSNGYGQVRLYNNPAGTESVTNIWSAVDGREWSADYNSQNTRYLSNGAYSYAIAPHPFTGQVAFNASTGWFPTSVTSLPDDTTLIGTGVNGITLIHKPTNPKSEFNYLTAFINTKYNSGWQPGVSVLATLADTNTGAWYGGNLIANPNLAGDSTSGWSGYGSSISASGGIMTVTPSSTLAGCIQTIPNLVPGRQYYMQCTVNTPINIGFRIQISGIGLRDDGYYSGTGQRVVQATFTASNTSHSPEFLAYGATVGQTFELSNFIFKECVADRSCQQNGVQVVGDRVPRNKVGSGSDLVSFGPFSSTSYLQQSYNSDLDWNSDADFTIVFWWNPRIDSAYDMLMERGYWSGGYSGNRWAIESGGQNTTAFKVNGLTIATTSSGGFANWQCICYTRRKGVITAYRNGFQTGRAVNTTDFTNTSAYLNIGTGVNAGSGFADNSHLALLRMSSSYSDEKMVKKIYNDEKGLFSPGAKATLYQDPDVGEREYGSSQAHNFVYGTDYDPHTGVYHVMNASGRSSFNTLGRIDHKDRDPSNSNMQGNSAISARDNLIVEE